MPRTNFQDHTAALKGLLVTFLWSSSYVLIKIGLEDIPALTFAGLRYGLAFLCLLPFALRPASLLRLKELSWGSWLRLVLLGLLFYAITQGASFLGLYYLPAGQVTGILIVSIGVLAIAGSSILGRRINRSRNLPPVSVTAVSMGVGAVLLMVTGLSVQDFPRLDFRHWAIIGWLAVVNTAFAFTLWNQTLRTLSATKSSIINGTMLIQIALLAWLFLGEKLTMKEIIGMILAGIGALLVQLTGRSGA